MKSDFTALTEKVYDLVIVGGGIYGAWIAWDATLRGLAVALLEKSDFGAATSANSLKIIHGGLRYLQHADLVRVRQSVREQKTLMRVAPHLVHPLPVLIPAYGHGRRGKEILSLALLMHELISFDRNYAADPQKHIPRGRTISKEEIMRLLPAVRQQGLAGGIIFYDAQVHNSERLLLSVLRSAAKAGAALANYVEVTGFLNHGGGIAGVQARNVLTGERFDVRGKTVVNTSGPWAFRLLGHLNGRRVNCQAPFVKAINLITRPIFERYAVGISGENRYHNAGALFNKGTNFLFFTPWRGHSLIGTTYLDYDGNPDNLKVTEKDIQNFLDEINQACPSARLRRNDVTFVHGGLLPSSGRNPKTGTVQLAKHCQFYDHRKNGVNGLLSVIGVKYTTARQVAAQAVDLIFEAWERSSPKSISSTIPVHGGRITNFNAFLEAETTKRPHGLTEQATRRLVYNYGSAYTDVLQYLDPRGNGKGVHCNEELIVAKAEVCHGVREEMAQKLSDVILRRTDLGTAGHPGNQVLHTCAETMAKELGWSSSKTQQEIQEVHEIYSIRH